MNNPRMKPFEYDGPAASLEEAAQREEQLQTECKRLGGIAMQLRKELANEQRRCSAREQQILDLGRLLKARGIDWRKDAVWTDSTAPSAP